MTTQLFPRAWKVVVDNLDVSTLDLEFEALASIKPEPNKCVLTIYNLNEDHRTQLLKRNKPDGPETKKIVGIPVQIEAGYTGNTTVIMSADLNQVGGSKDVIDRKMVLSGSDGGRAYREGRINQSFAKGTPVSQVFNACCEAMGVGLGNASSFTASAQISGLGTALPGPMTLSGNAADQLTRVTNSMNLTWSIQHGALQIMQKGKPLDSAAIKISPSTGLLESPQAAVDSTVSLGSPQQFAAGAKQKVAKPPKPKDPGILKLKTMLIPGLAPGRKIDLESEDYNGGYMITECRWHGQTWAQTWEVELVARIY